MSTWELGITGKRSGSEPPL